MRPSQVPEEVQVATKSGSNQVHGSAYEYFRNEALNANDANLKAVNEQRPVMRRNVYGVTVGGPAGTELFSSAHIKGRVNRTGPRTKASIRVF